MASDTLLNFFLVCCILDICVSGLSSNIKRSFTSPFRVKRAPQSSNRSSCVYEQKTYSHGAFVTTRKTPNGRTACERCDCLLGIVLCSATFNCKDAPEDREKQDTSTDITHVQKSTIKGCTLPDHPEHGKWTIVGGAKGEPNTNVAISTILTFSCGPQYTLSSNSNFIACLDEGWRGPIPVCLQLCPPLYNTDVINVTCYDENLAEIDCTKATNDATAKFECSSFYEPTDNAIRYCFDGAWHLPPPQCTPVCGEKRVTADTLIVNGKNVMNGNYPWVTAVFQNQNGKIINVCGGSMLNQRVIITAAHCVTDGYGNVMDKSLFHVGVGKYHNKYMDPQDTLAQYSDIHRILVHPKYKGEIQKHASDIALLITKDRLRLSKVVQPVCYQNINNIHLNLRSVGVVTGWGYTEPGGSPSDILKEIDIPYKDDATCATELPADLLNNYFTYDKFCAGYYNKSIAVCKGDSGGGLVFPNRRDGRYYIYGLVSVALKVTEGCDIQLSSLYTKVSVHLEWIELMTARYR